MSKTNGAAKLTHLPFSLLTELCRTGKATVQNKRQQAAAVELQAKGAASQNLAGEWVATTAAPAILAADIALPGKRH